MSDNTPDDEYDAYFDGEHDDTEPYVDPGTGQIVDPDDPFAIMAGHLKTLSEAVKAQSERQDKFEEQMNALPDGKWAWASLKTEEKGKLWRELYAWVAWLDDRYLRHIGADKVRLVPNWYRHPVAVELLTALMVAHQSAYQRKASKPSFTLVEWHERCLFPTFTRLEQLGLFPTATDSETWDGPTVRPNRRDDDRFNAFVNDALSPAPTPPSPTRDADDASGVDARGD
ncbi:hypothetical protein ACIRCZ_18595 [Leifsonia sp. NPDC102414]|uniref:hypothetical protein n=1 Tax=Leifsonia sp. NPDC102414 TaxID=3364124 RepID=UPI0038147A71